MSSRICEECFDADYDLRCEYCGLGVCEDCYEDWHGECCSEYDGTECEY